MCVFRQSGIGIPADRDDLHLESRDRRQNPQEFLGLTACAQCQNSVAVRHHSEVAVQGVERIEHDRRRPRTRQSRGNFAANVTGFSYTEHDNFPARVDRRLEEFNGVGKTLTQAPAQTL